MPLSVSTQTVGTFVVGLPQTFVVNATNDEAVDTDGLISLREALQLANNAPGADSITFDPTVFSGATTITLGLGTLSIADSVTIIGPAAALTIDANMADRHMSINGPGILNVSISNMTFINGLKAGLFAGFEGGSISDADENLTLTQLHVHEQRDGTRGGAISSAGGNLTINQCTFDSNTVTAGGGWDGGAIAFGGTGTLTIAGSTITGNHSDGPGGGISMSAAGTLNVTDSTISGNGTSTGNGGGINFLIGGTLNLARSTVSGNSAAASGGGISMYQPTGMTITNSTISGNIAGSDGGGVYLNKLAVAVTIQNSTLTLNSSSFVTVGGGGVGLKAVQTGGSLTLSSTIVAQNVNSNTPDVASDTAINVAGNNNLIGVADVGNITYTGHGQPDGHVCIAAGRHARSESVRSMMRRPARRLLMPNWPAAPQSTLATTPRCWRPMSEASCALAEPRPTLGLSRSSSPLRRP